MRLARRPGQRNLGSMSQTATGGRGRRPPARRGYRVGAALCLAAAMAPRTADASCAQPEAELLWSYPAGGQQDVPTNADLWLLVSGWSELRVTLDGAELPSLAGGRGRDLGSLAPNTEHSVSIERLWSGFPAEQPLELRFTTGPGPAPDGPPSAPGEVVATIHAERPLSALCESVLQTQDCFDTGQNTYFQFEPSGAAQAWLIESAGTYNGVNLWPADCGPPQLYLYAESRPCVTLHAIDETGATVRGEEVCTPTGDGTAMDNRAVGAGCSLPHDGASRLPRSWGLLAWGALGLLGLARRTGAVRLDAPERHRRR